MNAVVTIYNGMHGAALNRLTYARHKRYAEKCGVEFFANATDYESFSDLMMHKMKIIQTLLNNRHNRILWIDADILIRHDSPNLFDIVDTYNFAAVNEGALCDKNQIKERCDHIVQTCHEEGMPVPEINGRYYNMGMFIINASQKELLDKRKTNSNHNWCDQSLINARIAQFWPIDMQTSLPECFNRFVYWGPKPDKFDECSYFLHYAGPPSHEKRISDMKNQSEKWGDL